MGQLSTGPLGQFPLKIREAIREMREKHPAMALIVYDLMVLYHQNRVGDTRLFLVKLLRQLFSTTIKHGLAPGV